MRPALRQILLSRPGWVFPGASVDLDFARGRYFGGYQSVNISVSRASTGYAQNLAGVWLPFGNNVPRITDQGFLIEEARTNKCTNFNANPTDLTNVSKSGDAASVLSVVDDSAALTSAGLQNIATSGKVFKLDNSLGVGVAAMTFSGTVGNTNPQTISAYIRVTSGSAQVAFSDNSGTSTAYTGATYFRVVSANKTPASSGLASRVLVQAGTVVYAILNDLEEGSFVTSPIIIAGASATRAADIPQLTGAAASAALAAKAAFFQTFGVEGTTGNNRLLDGSPSFMIYAGASTVTLSGLATASANFGSGTYSSIAKSAFGFDGVSGTAVANGGSKTTTAGAAGPLTSTTGFGNNSGGIRALNGYMQRFALSPTKGAFDALTA